MPNLSVLPKIYVCSYKMWYVYLYIKWIYHKSEIPVISAVMRFCGVLWENVDTTWSGGTRVLWQTTKKPGSTWLPGLLVLSLGLFSTTLSGGTKVIRDLAPPFQVAPKLFEIMLLSCSRQHGPWWRSQHLSYPCQYPSRLGYQQSLN